MYRNTASYVPRPLFALSLHMQVMIRIINHSLRYFHSCLTAYLKAYKKQQMRVDISHLECFSEMVQVNMEALDVRTRK